MLTVFRVVTAATLFGGATGLLRATTGDTYVGATTTQHGAQSLPVLLTIDWRRLEDLPAQGPLHQGFQDSDGGVIDGGATLVTAFG